MTEKTFEKKKVEDWTRRKFLSAILAGGITGASSYLFANYFKKKESKAQTFIGSVSDYNTDLKTILLKGFEEISISSSEVNGKRVLLKPNLVEPHKGLDHINTNPKVILAAAEAFFYLGASEVIVAEGAGHRRDSLLVLEESGLADLLYENKIPFIDLNSGPVVKVKNSNKKSKLEVLVLPNELLLSDFVVSLPKMKTHHWAGVTLSMKNMFGVMPGMVYGWPKNVLHWAGINQTILDINSTIKPNLAIVDGIVGMEGDGPIMGDPVKSSVLVMGRNLTAVDATCARIMGINPERIPHLKYASGWLGTIKESNIDQRGEKLIAVQKKFKLFDYIPAQKGIRL